MHDPSLLTKTIPAIQALLNSIAPGNTQGTGTADAVKKLTEKLGELVGEDAMKEFNQGRNERGEVCSPYHSTRSAT